MEIKRVSHGTLLVLSALEQAIVGSDFQESTPRLQITWTGLKKICFLNYSWCSWFKKKDNATRSECAYDSLDVGAETASKYSTSPQPSLAKLKTEMDEQQNKPSRPE